MPLPSTPEATFVAVTPAVEPLMAEATSSREFEAGVISSGVPEWPTIVMVEGEGHTAMAAETPTWDWARALTTTWSSPALAPVATATVRAVDELVAE